MCGILAQYTKKDNININLFNESLALLNHRGPDETDHTVLDNGHLVFGHTRLSIIGVNNGTQPLSSNDNKLFTIINGEFYDYQQIKQNFINQGYHFKTNSDSEIILPLYQQHKYAAFNQLNGEFAGVIYDVLDNKLILFRDRHGVKPLYFKKTANSLIIASEIKAILNIDKSQPQWNVDYLKQSFNFIRTQDSTLYQDIYQVKPGHYIICDLNTFNLTQHQYWQIDFNKNNYLNLSLTELSQKYEEEFIKAISRRLVADVPVATYLSGGIDSSACYGVASHLVGKGVDAFTISFDNLEYDEFHQAQTLVKQYNGTHHVLKISEQLLLDHYDQHLWNMEGISNNTGSVAKYLLSKVVRDAGFKVVITGEGSDEYNAGYAFSVMDALKYEHLKTTNVTQYPISQGSLSVMNDDLKPLDYTKQIFGFSPAWFENAASSEARFNQLYVKQFQEPTPNNNIEHLLKQRYLPEMKNWDILNTSLYLTGQTTFTYVLAILGDRTEMAHSVEARLPFLDHNLLEFLAKVPPQYKATPKMDKFLLREAMKKYVTKEHYMTPKHPYLAPPLIKSRSLFANYMQDVFSSSWFINSGLFEHKKVQNMLKTLTSLNKPDPAIERQLFQILSFAILHKTFNFKNL